MINQTPLQPRNQKEEKVAVGAAEKATVVAAVGLVVAIRIKILEVSEYRLGKTLLRRLDICCNYSSVYFVIMPYNVAFTLGYGNYGNNNYKKKSKTKSTLKKAAVIGVTAYGAYQLGKLSNRFGGYGGGYGYGGHHYNYRQWNNWREIDGFMCRNDKDCNWIDQRLYCQDYELKFQPSVSILYKRSKSSKTCL